MAHQFRLMISLLKMVHRKKAIAGIKAIKMYYVMSDSHPYSYIIIFTTMLITESGLYCLVRCCNHLLFLLVSVFSS
jgi:hypothetical protein